MNENDPADPRQPPNPPASRAHATPPRLTTCPICGGSRRVRRLGAFLDTMEPCAACRYRDPVTGVRASFPFCGSVDAWASPEFNAPGSADVWDPTSPARLGTDWASRDRLSGAIDRAKPGDDLATAVDAFRRDTQQLQQRATDYGTLSFDEDTAGADLQRRLDDRSAADVRRGIAIGLTIGACVAALAALLLGLVRWAP